MNDETSLISVSDLFACMGVELRDLARQLDGVEAALSELTAASSQMPKDAVQVLVTDLQALDLILQSLNSLSHFSERLSRTMVAPAMIDITPATDAITLSDLAARLKGRHVAAKPVAATGDIEYF